MCEGATDEPGARFGRQSHGARADHINPTKDSIPSPDAPWRPDIAKFDLSFDGYEALGERTGDLANTTQREWSETGELPDDLTALRSYLFFEQRRYRYFGWDPDGDAMVYIQALVEAIRERVVEGEEVSR